LTFFKPWDIEALSLAQQNLLTENQNNVVVNQFLRDVALDLTAS
jgi:hypothetical protein